MSILADFKTIYENKTVSIAAVHNKIKKKILPPSNETLPLLQKNFKIVSLGLTVNYDFHFLRIKMNVVFF